MRVLLVHNRYRIAGGEERHLDLLNEELPRHAVEARRYEPSSPANASLTVRARIAAGLVYRPGVAKAVRSAVEDWGADVVHAHNLTPLLTPAALHGAKAAGAAVVYTAHNYRLVCPAGTMTRDGVGHDDCIRSSLVCGLHGGRGSRLESIAYGVAIELQRRLHLVDRWVDAYVTPSRSVADVLTRAGFSPSRIHVIPHGVDGGRRDLGTAEFGLFAGRLTNEKGVRTLLRAVELSGVPIAFAGAGPLADVVAANAGEKVQYLGVLSADEVAAVRTRAAFVVAPSEWPEVLPFSVLEALAQGVPVIATEIGGLREIAEGGGVHLVPPRDARALADAMLLLWDDRGLRDELAREATHSAQTRYSLEHQTATLVDLYRELVNRS